MRTPVCRYSDFYAQLYQSQQEVTLYGNPKFGQHRQDLQALGVDPVTGEVRARASPRPLRSDHDLRSRID